LTHGIDNGSLVHLAGTRAMSRMQHFKPREISTLLRLLEEVAALEF
jgi:hypothetical protein